MKRIYNLEENDNDYIIILDENNKFLINKGNLKLDGTEFYDMFFKEFLKGDIIELKKGSSFDEKNKLSIGVFETVNELINDIIKKIEEIED